MPRKSRIDAPDALQHIIARGIERRSIFRSDNDRNDFLHRLSDLIPQTGTDCYAWALLSNHFHLLLKTNTVPIAVLMGRLLTGYAGWFNKKYQRHGPLFQNRYKSVLCQQDLYLKELVRYIHLNPLRVGIVAKIDELDHYPWCGHSVLMNNTVQSWQNVDFVLSLFAKEKKLSRLRYRIYIERGIKKGRRPELTGGGVIRSTGGWAAYKGIRKAGIRVKGDERILGDSDFVTGALKLIDEPFEQKYGLKVRGYDFGRVVARVAREMDMLPEEVTASGKSPRTVQARALLCFWAHRQLGMTTVEIASRLAISQSAVSRLSMRGAKIARERGVDLIETESQK
jgi:REP element-mobilizing transposase RayT